MTWQLTYRHPQSVPVEIEGITPDRLMGKTAAQVERLGVLVGNQEIPLAELFAVSGDDSNQRLHLVGDLSGVHWIGAKMQSGHLHVQGPAGRHLGSEMEGGNIEVDGDAGDWVGAELHRGTIHVRGRAGHLVGAAYRGSRRGMTGGTILVDGSVGNELGHTMRRGLIAVGGGAGDVVGFNMLAGTVVVLGNVGIRHGAGMKRGTLALLGDERPKVLPTFRFACRFRPMAITLVLRRLRELCFAVPEALLQREVELFNGDLITGGRGELIVGTS